MSEGLAGQEGQGRLRDGGTPPGLGWWDLVAVGMLAALALLFFWKIALTNRVLAGVDVFAYFYPYRDLASAALRAGRLPLWNPYLFMGAPFLANSQAAVLYPLHWPLIWLSTPKQIAWSIVLHIWLAGVGAYLYARLALRLRPVAAGAGAAIFALGGFLGAQVEHLNQLNASAWLPWLLLCVEGAFSQERRKRWPGLLGGGAVVALCLLAGHTQAAYIVVSGAAVYAAVRGWWDPARPGWRTALRGLAAVAVMGVAGVALAAGQILPTLELSRWSVRSGGLPYNEAASFSLKPTLIFKAFLPPLAWDLPFSEYVAYAGLVGLALATGGAWAVVRRRPRAGSKAQAAWLQMVAPRGRTMIVLALLGVFLAFGAYNPIYYLLYRVVPGFDLFRVPARWLLLYSFGAAMLAGIGLEALPRLRSWKVQAPIALLLVLELFLAGRRLAYNSPTAPAAFDSMRTAPSHLLADDAAAPFRFLSMSDIGYDPGDMGDLQAMYADYMPPAAIYDLIVATKMKEVLAYNLPLRYRLYSVDGYDGGLLPVRNYVLLERLFVAEEEIWPDGRLRQQLRQVPPARLLSLLNVKYAITDKTQDVWIDDVFYDLEHSTPLGKVTLAHLPEFETSHLGVVSYLAGAAGVADGTPVARVVVTSTEGITVTAVLRAGVDTAEGQYSTGGVQHGEATVAHGWRDDQAGNDYITVVDLGARLQPAAISLQSLLSGRQVVLRGLTLIDEEEEVSRSVSVDPAFKLVHSGDVKIYENRTAPGPARIVQEARVAPDDEVALDMLRDPGFDPGQTVILAGGEALAAGAGGGEVEVIDYAPERIELRARLDAPGYLVLADTYYPGWRARVDGREVPIQRADVYFRALALDEGEHDVTFEFRPVSVYAGLAAGLLAWLVWVALAVGAVRSPDR